MIQRTPESLIPVGFLCLSVVCALSYALTLTMGFLPFFAISVLATVLSLRRSLVLPGSLFICFFTLLMILGPYLDLRFEVLTKPVSDLYGYFPENYLLLGLVALILLMLVVHLLTLSEEKTRRFHLMLRRISPQQLMLVLVLGAGSEAILFALGAGRHTAGFNEIPFVGVLSTIKTLPELLVIIAAFNSVRSRRKGMYATIITSTLLLNLITSVLSGRKEDLMMSGFMTLVGYWAAVKSPGKFLIKTLVPLLVVIFLFLPFMYRLRAHPAFNRLDQTSTPVEIIQDTLAGKYVDQSDSGNVLQRMDLLEPTARYFGKPTAPMYDQRDIWVMLACEVIPRFLWPDKPLVQPEMGYQFSVYYGYTSDFGITSIAFGYLVELHFLFGWPGVALLVLLPWAFNSRWAMNLGTIGRIWPWVWMWILYKFAVFVERTLVSQLVETIPYVLLAVIVEACLSVYRSGLATRFRPPIHRGQGAPVQRSPVAPG